MRYGPDKLPVMGQVGQLSREVEGSYQDLAVNRQGALIGIDQILQWALDGRTFLAQQGDAGTKLDFAETAYDEDQPQFALRVPTGKIVIPLSLSVELEDMAGTLNNIIWSTTTNDIGNGTSTAISTISPMRTDAPRSSGCTARSLYTGNATAATGLMEFARWHDEFAAVSTGPNPGYVWNIREAAAVPVLVGPATLQAHIYATGTAPQGWGEYVWVEFETPDLVNPA